METEHENGIIIGKVPRIRMNSGYTIPQVGFGTWMAEKEKVGQAVLEAIDIGYRHVDCAQIYQNEREIGVALEKALKSGKVARDELFVTTKLWNSCHSYQKALEAIDERIHFLRVQYLDLCLIHWPMGYDEDDGYIPMDSNGKVIMSRIDYMETWRAMEDAVNTGKVRSIGISNFNKRQIERIMAEGRIAPAVLQVEAHPYFAQSKLLKWCLDRGIVFTGYSPLANNQHEFRVQGQPNLLQEPILIEIGKIHGKTPAQIALRWGFQKGMVIIPKSVRRSRIEENFDILDFHLTDKEIANIDTLENGWRMLPLDRDSHHPDWPFHDDI